jgi:hypothetical protein
MYQKYFICTKKYKNFMKLTLHFENNLSHPCVKRFNKNWPSALESNRTSKISDIQKYKVVLTTLENNRCKKKAHFFPPFK